VNTPGRRRGVAVLAAVAAGIFVKKKWLSQNPKKAKEFVEVKLKDASGKKKKVGVNKEFFERLKKLFKICVPTMRSKEGTLLLLQAMFLFSRTFVSIMVAKLDGYIVKKLVTGKLYGFLWGLAYWLMLSVPATYTNSMIKYLQMKLSLAFRTKLVRYIHQQYLGSDMYYKIGNLDSRIENADQRITTDVNNFCNAVSELYSNLSKPLLDIVLFGAQLYVAVGPTAPLAMTNFYVLTGLFLKVITPPFGKLAAQQASLEGNFRFCHNRLITNAEEIAFYGGEKIEHGILNVRYDKLVRHVNHVLKLKIPHSMIEGMIVKYVSSVVGLVVCAVPVFFTDSDGSLVFDLNKAAQIGKSGGTGNRTAQYTTNRRYLINLAEAIGRILYSYKEVSEVAGYTARVYELLNVLDEVAKGKCEKTISSANKKKLATFTGGQTKRSESIIFEDVPIVTPNGDVLVDALNLTLEPGMHLLITGPNGCGKSSLFRTLGGLWPVQHGIMHRPGPKDIFYIPQRPYLVLGTLREQIIYPDSVEDMQKRGYTDEFLLEIMENCHLAYLLPREGGWDATKEWKDVLSGGEKQRVGMARLFYHKPRYAILDECTSQTSLDVEGLMYTHAKKIGITLMTVSHRPSLWQYHSHVLQFDGEGGVEVKQLNGTHRMGLEEEKANLLKKLSDVPSLQARLGEIQAELGEALRTRENDAESNPDE